MISPQEWQQKLRVDGHGPIERSHIRCIQLDAIREILGLHKELVRLLARLDALYIDAEATK